MKGLADIEKVGDGIYNVPGTGIMMFRYARGQGWELTWTDGEGRRHVEQFRALKDARQHAAKLLPPGWRRGDQQAKESPMSKKEEKAGAEYAAEQIKSVHFAHWIREQMYEASRMDPSQVLPLETKDDARVIARNMLQDLEWDTKRQLDESRDFFKGFSAYLKRPTVVDWLADEILEINRELHGGYDGNGGGRHSWKPSAATRAPRRAREPLPSQRRPLPPSKSTPIRAVPKYEAFTEKANYAIEVIGGTGKRGWRFWDGYYATEDDAITMTEHLIQSGRHQAVRVVSIREGWKPVWEWPKRTRWSSLWREGRRRPRQRRRR